VALGALKIFCPGVVTHAYPYVATREALKQSRYPVFAVVIKVKEFALSFSYVRLGGLCIESLTHSLLSTFALGASFSSSLDA
jgi:hypothetical protein